MTIRTASLGEVEATPESFLTLPEGLIGFEDHHEFVLLELSDFEPFCWLLSYTDPGLSFPLLRPEPLLPDYQVDLLDVERDALELSDGERPDVFVIASIHEEGEQVTVNLRAPLVVNPRSQGAPSDRALRRPLGRPASALHPQGRAGVGLAETGKGLPHVGSVTEIG